MATISLDPTLTRRDAALRFLYDRVDYERFRSYPYREGDLRLDRMRELLVRLGNPQRGLPIVHVAGTKGKGSTSAMTAAVLSAAGYRTGLFTSPHLDRMEERLAIDGTACTADEFSDLVERVAPVVLAMDAAAAACRPPEQGPTVFEITTAMALCHFTGRGADAAVLEVGLGGRLDSTNVCEPRVSAITSISFDHTQQLGGTLEKIAWEKSGIIKPGVPVVSGVTDPGPRDVIRQVCRERGSRLAELGTDFDFRYRAPRRLESSPGVGEMDFSYRGEGCGHEYRGLELRLLGRHQAANAAVALAVLAELARGGWEIPESAVRAGLAGLSWPARVELVARRPAIVVDAAHNVASMEALLRVLDESFSVPRRLLVFATTQEKDLRGMLARLAGRFDHVVLTNYLNNPRAVPVAEVAAVAGGILGQPFQVCAEPAEAWDAACALAGPEDLICVTGSFFIAAEMRQQIRLRPAGAATQGAAAPRTS